MGWVGMARAVFRLWNSPVWSAARRAVKAVAADRALHAAAQAEPNVSYCPRCGQLPDGDRRFEEAREMALVILSPAAGGPARRGAVPKRRDLDFALAFHYWSSRL